MKAAILNGNNIVVNLIVWDGTSVAPTGMSAIVLPDEYYVSTGFIYDSKTAAFIDPTPQAPIDPAL